MLELDGMQAGSILLMAATDEAIAAATAAASKMHVSPRSSPNTVSNASTNDLETSKRKRSSPGKTNSTAKLMHREG